jgi:hypothetical protein
MLRIFSASAQESQKVSTVIHVKAVVLAALVILHARRSSNSQSEYEIISIMSDQSSVVSVELTTHIHQIKGAWTAMVFVASVYSKGRTTSHEFSTIRKQRVATDEHIRMRTNVQERVHSCRWWWTVSRSVYGHWRRKHQWVRATSLGNRPVTWSDASSVH